MDQTHTQATAWLDNSLLDQSSDTQLLVTRKTHAEAHPTSRAACPDCKTRERIRTVGWQEPDTTYRRCLAGCDIREQRYYRTLDGLLCTEHAPRTC